MEVYISNYWSLHAIVYSKVVYSNSSSIVSSLGVSLKTPAR